MKSKNWIFIFALVAHILIMPNVNVQAAANYNLSFEVEDTLVNIPKIKGENYHRKNYQYQVSSPNSYDYLLLFQEGHLAHIYSLTILYSNGISETYGNPKYLTSKELGSSERIRSVLESCNQGVAYAIYEKNPSYLKLSYPNLAISHINVTIGYGYYANFKGRIVGVAGKSFIRNDLNIISGFRLSERSGQLKIKKTLQDAYTSLLM
jgi:hypothetical protein